MSANSKMKTLLIIKEMCNLVCLQFDGLPQISICYIILHNSLD